MSIRMRLTLLYTAILAMTLIAFSVMVYGIQSQSAVSLLEQTLDARAQRTVELRRRQLRGEIRPFPLDRGDVPTRTLTAPDMHVQLRSLDTGDIKPLPGPGEVVLPLSDAGLHTVQNGEPWVETASVEDERLLILSQPVMIEGQVTEVVQMARSLAEQDQYLSALSRNLFLGTGLATVIAFGIGWVLSGLTLRPIHRITQTAQAIGAERDFRRRVQHTGPHDEVGQLATTFNAMLTELQAAYQQVEQALELQRRFVADVSHELRTPLTTLNGNVELLRREPPISDEDRAGVLSDMAGESKRLIRLVNDLLTLARADARSPLRCEPVRIRPIIEEACRQAGLLDPDRSIRCDPLPDVAVLGEADALKQVLLILLDNALKHTGGSIAVTTETVDEGVAVRVHDAGPGIEPEILPHLFERFSRGEAARAEPGTGLGLAIAEALVEAQGGTIAVESHVGQGSVFTVTLPPTRSQHPRCQEGTAM